MPRGMNKDGSRNKGQFVKGVRRPHTAEQRRKMKEGMRRAWETKRKRLPIGSQYIDRDGYVRVKVVTGAGQWIPEHIIVMQGIIGRDLKQGEVVHHINGCRSDNRPENLYLCRDRSHHNDVHKSQDSALRQLLESGKVIFEDGAYKAIF